MKGLRMVIGDGVDPPADGFEIGYLTPDGAQVRVPLTDAWSVRLESAPPARSFASYKGQRHFPGRWWTATEEGHVGYESWLERDHLMLLDFDPAIIGIASQPFWLFWSTEDRRKGRSHAPDYFARKADGSGVVVDCRPAERRKPRDLAAFEATRKACGLVGWEYRLVGAPDSIVTANVRWLGGYRHPRHSLPEIATALGDAFHSPRGLLAGAEAVGDPIAVLPVLFHLLWRQELVVDLSVPLHQAAIVSRTPLT
ncbi:TnsA-like heteromeric transposase endonuclease subunit [Actinoallomurus purpureus]|uniref:TnsA-like heteromeric transposase endonuclease subunit n=1 Tax=Actinoallomurus purpureus TaxID=478114 RepID=UPI00209325E9|nr:TnsA-like heteromeric transposase endonuclease subunit [Actinoallomurus purpureus]MCO6004926.1 TnsA-like heteromeric transposase endonuclease subunit [Actinoallomurus purpureus]